MHRPDDPHGEDEPTGAAQRRPALVLVTIAATAVGLLGLAGVFATLTDRATTGQNEIETELLVEPPLDLDLLIAERATDGTCGEFTDDLATGLFTMASTSIEAPFPHPRSSAVCLRNYGTEAGWITLSAIDVDDRELSCTYREAEEDGTCGNDGAGELAPIVDVTWGACDGSSEVRVRSITELSERPAPFLFIFPEDTLHLCLVTSLHDPVSVLTKRAAQSDELTWRFAFDLADQPFEEVGP